jgi:hypothetical protein
MSNFHMGCFLFKKLSLLSRAKACCRLFLVFAISLVCACEKRPANNSAEYLHAHGITLGVENSVRVGGSIFVIPANIPLEVFTEGDIEKGIADTLTFYLDFSSILKNFADAGVLSPASVRVEIKNLSSINETSLLDAADGRDWASVEDLRDIGLTEFRAKRFDGGWGYLSYQATDPTARTPLGGPIQYSCRGSPESGPDMCWSSFRLNAKTTVWYFLSDDLLPHWSTVHRTIIKTLHIYERT